MRIRKLLAGLGAAALVALSVSACSSEPSNGYIWEKDYNPPSQWYVPGYSYSMCSGSGSYRSCFTEWQPGYWIYYPPSWQLKLCDKSYTSPTLAKGISCGYRYVDEGTYATAQLGTWYGPPQVAAPVAVKKSS